MYAYIDLSNHPGEANVAAHGSCLGTGEPNILHFSDYLTSVENRLVRSAETRRVQLSSSEARIHAHLLAAAWA